MAAALRLLLLALVCAVTLVAGATAGLAAHARAHVNAALLRAQRGEWLRIVPIRPVPLGVRAVVYAKRFIGSPYSYGGSSPSGFDCSGFVRYVYERFGIELPHSSYADFGLGRRVSRAALRPGDLVFFSGRGHVGLYVGDGRFIHAPHSGTRVQISSLADYGSSYDGARRVAAA